MSRRPPKFVVIPVLLVVVAAVVFAILRGRGAAGALEATGTVEATDAALGFTVPGRLEAVRVEEGDTVSAQMPLAWLDRSETQGRRDQAAAQVAAAQAQLLELERGSRPQEITAARASAKAAADKLADAERDAERVRSLRERNVVSQQDLDKATTALDVARSAKVQADEQRRLVELGPRAEKVTASRASAGGRAGGAAHVRRDARANGGARAVPGHRHRAPPRAGRDPRGRRARRDAPPPRRPLGAHLRAGEPHRRRAHRAAGAHHVGHVPRPPVRGARRRDHRVRGRVHARRPSRRARSA